MSASIQDSPTVPKGPTLTSRLVQISADKTARMGKDIRQQAGKISNNIQQQAAKVPIVGVTIAVFIIMILIVITIVFWETNSKGSRIGAGIVVMLMQFVQFGIMFHYIYKKHKKYASIKMEKDNANTKYGEQTEKATFLTAASVDDWYTLQKLMEDAADSKRKYDSVLSSTNKEEIDKNADIIYTLKNDYASKLKSVNELRAKGKLDPLTRITIPEARSNLFNRNNKVAPMLGDTPPAAVTTTTTDQESSGNNVTTALADASGNQFTDLDSFQQ